MKGRNVLESVRVPSWTTPQFPLGRTSYMRVGDRASGRQRSQQADGSSELHGKPETTSSTLTVSPRAAMVTRRRQEVKTARSRPLTEGRSRARRAVRTGCTMPTMRPADYATFHRIADFRRLALPGLTATGDR